MFEWLSRGSYRELHRGASGGTTAPEAEPRLTGAQHANAGEYHGANRNAMWRDPARGLAASHPPEVTGVSINDFNHNSNVDGHPFAQNANMLDSQFAQNTAATSNYSRHANFAIQRQKGLQVVGKDLRGVSQPNYIPYDQTFDLGLGEAQVHLKNTSTRSRSLSVDEIASERQARLVNERGGEAEWRAKGGGEGVLVKPSYERMDYMPRSAANAFLTRDFTGSELGLMGIGLYVAYSIIARA